MSYFNSSYINLNTLNNIKIGDDNYTTSQLAGFIKTIKILEKRMSDLEKSNELLQQKIKNQDLGM